MATRKLVESFHECIQNQNPSMNVSKTRKRESKTLMCVLVCVRVCEHACVSLLWFLFVSLFFVGLCVFVFPCLSLLFALSNCFRVQKKRYDGDGLTKKL